MCRIASLKDILVNDDPAAFINTDRKASLVHIIDIL